MSEVGDRVNVEKAIGNSISLFRSDDDSASAWSHFVDHVLNHFGEWEGWCLLLTGLAKERSKASDMDKLKTEADGARPNVARAELKNLYRDYLTVVSEAIEKAIDMEWYWGQRDPDDQTCWHTFSPCGVRAIFDSEKVRTGHLPCGSPFGHVPVNVERYNLFICCLKKMRDKHQRAIKGGEMIDPPGLAFEAVLKHDPDMATWQKY
jgi:hypothetical protein